MGYLNIIFPQGIGAAFQPAFDEAGAFWNNVVTAGAAPTTLDNGLDVSGTQCNVNYQYAPGSVINGIDLFASIPDIDGPGQILGRAGPCVYHGSIRDRPLFPMLGIMEFDVADSAGLVEEGQFANVVVHEMGHVIGLGTLWPALEGILINPCPIFFPRPCDPYYVAPNGKQGFQQLNPPSSIGVNIPVANTGGTGTANGHWREVTFENELMTGYLNADRENPLSIMTVLSLKDLGYSVNIEAAEPYTVPAQSVAKTIDENAIQLIGDTVLLEPEFIEEIKNRLRPVNGETESENYEGMFSAMFLVMLAGFILLGGYFSYLQRKQRKFLEDVMKQQNSVRSPMHKA